MSDDTETETPLSRLAAAYESSDDGGEPLVYSHAFYLYSCLTCDSMSPRSIQEKKVQRPPSSGERLIGDGVAQEHHLQHWQYLVL